MESRHILVTGGAGSIGSELVRQLAPKNTIHVLDIDETRLFDLVEELRLEGHSVSGSVCDVRNTIDCPFIPNAIFHVAARKHVTPMEQTPMEAVEVNIKGTHNILEYAKKNGVNTLVNISTDKVVNADCVMGATKKVAELMVKNAGYTSVRFGNVLGSRGSVIPIWQKQIDSGKPLTITDIEMTRYMMTIEEACRLIIEASEAGKRAGRIFILDMGNPIKILDLAKEILGKAGKNTNEYKVIGVRPGEKLYETLMTEEERKRAVKIDNFFVI